MLLVPGWDLRPFKWIPTRVGRRDFSRTSPQKTLSPALEVMGNSFLCQKGTLAYTPSRKSQRGPRTESDMKRKGHRRTNWDSTEGCKRKPGTAFLCTLVAGSPPWPLEHPKAADEPSPSSPDPPWLCLSFSLFYFLLSWLLFAM